MPATSTTRKPARPYKEFPLFAHPNGQWAKKIKGKQWYFGKWEDHESALQRYLDEIDDIQAGRDPRRQGIELVPDAVTVADMCNLFLAAMDVKRGAGEITTRHFLDCTNSCKTVIAHFGRRVAASTLKASDFAALRKAFPPTWGPAKTGTEIQRMRSAFKWAAESEVIPSMPNFGPNFKRPAKRIIRLARQERQAEHGTLDFTAQQLRTLLENTNGWLRACILIAINSGFGNADCGRLKVNHIDFDDGWYDLPRRKTGISRRFHLWQETRDAIHEAMQLRPIAKDEADDALCFLTSHGRPVWWETESGRSCDNIAKSFLKLCKKCKMYKPGRNFYSLRRTFETVGGNSKDQVAVNYSMGHEDESMAAVYRQGIDDQRLIDVAEHVRQWLWTRKCNECGETQFSVADEWTCASCDKDNPVDAG
ncbi:MAG: phage integrase family protein [Fuerstiella sp.]|nr:phage integrase family protein [Fuerstiella sp.]MCP4854123.1 phage integrase family protein [Fuerstiella sp.]